MKTYFVNCHIDLYKTKHILKNKNLWGDKVYGFIDNDNSVVDIDTIDDFHYAEYLMTKNWKVKYNFEYEKKPYMIAEIGINHNGDLEIAKKPISTLKRQILTL